jgi:hypothetical protein
MERLPREGRHMNTQRSCDSYRMNREIYKGLLWLNVWLLKVLLIWAQFVPFTQG